MKQTQLDIGTIGQKLKQAREIKKVSISEAGSQTRILSKFISAMEEDNFKALSAPVYVKSFIRLYAKYLEIDSKSLIDSYEKEYETDDTPFLSDDTKRNLAETDASIGSVNEEDSSDKSVKSIFSIWTKNTSSWITNKSSLSKNILQILIGVGFLIILLLLSQCGEQEDKNTNIDKVKSFNTIAEPIPDLYLNDNEIVEWTR